MKKICKVFMVTLVAMGILFCQVQPTSAKTLDWSVRHLQGAPESEQKYSFVKSGCKTNKIVTVIEVNKFINQKVDKWIGIFCSTSNGIAASFLQEGSASVKTKKKIRISMRIDYLGVPQKYHMVYGTFVY